MNFQLKFTHNGCILCRQFGIIYACFFAYLQSEVSLIQGTAQFVSSGVVEVNGEQFSANHILIATGGRPAAPTVPGTTNSVFTLALLN